MATITLGTHDWKNLEARYSNHANAPHGWLVIKDRSSDAFEFVIYAHDEETGRKIRLLAQRITEIFGPAEPIPAPAPWGNPSITDEHA